MNIFFDLDGTLIDSRKRLYDLFLDLSGITMTFEEYWVLKRSMVSNKNILENNSFNQAQISSFQKKWMDCIELPEYLIKDKMFVFTSDVLMTLYKKGYKLYVITARQFDKRATDQLKNLGIIKYFENCLITEQKFNKCDLIIKNKISLSSNDFIVGDTGLDVKAGKKLGIKTVAVLTGFRNEENLRLYSPDYICEDILEFSQNILD